MPEIRFIPKAELPVILPLIKLLNPKTHEELLRQRLEEMQSTSYQCVGAFEDGKLIGICGLWILHKLYVGRHLEPDNVVVLPEYRGKKVGEALPLGRGIRTPAGMQCHGTELLRE